MAAPLTEPRRRRTGARRRTTCTRRPTPRPAPGSPCARPTSCTSAARSRAPSRAARTSSRRADGTPLANAVRASRKDVRDAVRAARKAFPGWAGKTAMNRGQVLYRVAELMEGRRDQFVDEVAAAEGLREPAAARSRRRGDRPLGLVRRLGRQDRPGARLVEPGRRRRTSTSRSRSRPASSASSRPRRRRCSGLVSRLAPAVVARQHRGRPGVRDPAAAGGDADRGARHVRRARRRRQRPDRPEARARPGPRRSRRRRRARPVGRARRRCGPTSSSLAADDVKRVLAPPDDRVRGRFDWLDDRAAERPEWIAAFLEMKTVWHPIGV